MAKKKILAVNFFPAFNPPKSGGEIRYFHIYKNLGEHYSVKLLSATYPFISPEELEIAPDVVEYRVPKTMTHIRLHQFFGKVGKFPECSALVVAIATNFHKEFKEKLAEFSRESDIIICDFPFIIPHIELSPKQVFIYNSYNVEYDLHKSMLKGFTGHFLSKYIKYLERKTCKAADILLATSREDKEGFTKVYKVKPEKIVLAPNGVDSNELQPVSEEEKKEAKKDLGWFKMDEKIALFFGSGHPPNIEAVKFIVEHIAPSLPKVHFFLAGAASKSINAKHLPNIHPCGIVSDEEKATLLAAADVAVNPMFSGSGTNLKMLDYMSMGLPIVSTPIGARGLEIKNGKEAIIASEKEFADAIKTLLSSDTLYQSLKVNSRLLIQKKYDWKQITESMHKTIEKVYNEKNHRS